MTDENGDSVLQLFFFLLFVLHLIIGEGENAMNPGMSSVRRLSKSMFAFTARLAREKDVGGNEDLTRRGP